MNHDHSGNGLSRRALLRGVVGTGVAVLLPMLAERAEADAAPQDWTDLGPSAQFVVNTPTRIALKKRPILWVTRTGPGTLLAVSAKCTHRGCKVLWVPSADQFVCPCHGSAFALDGRNIHGPGHHTDANLKALTAYPVRETDGQVQVDFTPSPSAPSSPATPP